MSSSSRDLEVLSESFPADSASIPRARQALVDFARAAGAEPEQVEALRLAVSEAITNAVLHAYPDGEGEVQVTAALADDEVWVLIADEGQGFRVRHDSPGLGMGLALIVAVSDYFALVKRSGGGTELRLRFGLRASPRRQDDSGRRAQRRGSVASATSPASSRFSTTR